MGQPRHHLGQREQAPHLEGKVMTADNWGSTEQIGMKSLEGKRMDERDERKRRREGTAMTGGLRKVKARGGEGRGGGDKGMGKEL